MKKDNNLIEVDFKKKRRILESEKEYIPGFTRYQLAFIILKINFACCFSRDDEEIARSLLLMSDLTGELFEYDWFHHITDFFEEYLSKNVYWHIKSCEDDAKRKYMEEQYWRGLVSVWKS